jgi:hypothetical protein
MSDLKSNNTNPQLIDAVCELIDVTLYWHCTVAGAAGDDSDSVMHTISCVDAVLRQVLATPELSARHAWAKRQLAAHRFELEV